jgi:PEGA domain
MNTSRVIAIVAAALVVAAGLAVFLWRSEPPAPPPSLPDGPAEDPEPALSTPVPSRLVETIAPRSSVPAGEPGSPQAEGAAAAETGTLSGEVFHPTGSPAAGAAVAYFASRDGAPFSKAERTAKCDERGRFNLAFPGAAPTEGIVVAFTHGRRPSTVHLAGDAGVPLKLRLGEGAAVEGTVTLDDAPVRDSIIGADIRFGVPGCFADSEELWWSGTAFETKSAQVVSDTEGRFRIAGLAQDIYRIDAQLQIREKGIGFVCREHVRAPMTGVRLGTRSGRLRIRVAGDGVVPARAVVAAIAPDGGQIRANGADMGELRVATDVPLKVEAAHPGFDPKSVAVPALAAGEVRELELVLARSASARLELTLRGADPALQRVHVRFVPATPTPDEDNHAQADVRRTLWATRAREGPFVIEHVPHPPGRYFIIVRNSDTFLLPIRQEVNLPAEGVLGVVADAVAGGKIEVVAIGPAEARPFGEYVLRDASGAEIARRGVGRGWHVSFRLAAEGITPHAETTELMRENGVLAPGTYEIEVTSEGYRPARRKVTVKPNETTKEEVRLEPAPK